MTNETDKQLQECGSCENSCRECPGCSPVSFEDLKRNITITLEDDTEIECAVLTAFPMEGKNYIALLPLDPDGQSSSGEVYLYAFRLGPSLEPLLSNIEEDDEYQKACEIFEQMMEQAETVASSETEDL